jgi:phosphoglycolate phosphatase-like HAD superfamily hydrolase
MPFELDHDIFIFDCDGVILNSNQLKINAMESALRALSINDNQVQQCSEYFRKNFGKSRYHHVEHFVSNILQIDQETTRKALELKIITLFSNQCRKLYLEAELTPGFLDFLQILRGKKYIASGSAQDELRGVFKERGLEHHFSGIYGSPTAKSDNINHILELEKTEKAVMFGDAISDLEASIANKIDFIAYRTYSNVPDLLTIQSKSHGFKVIDSWSELL